MTSLLLLAGRIIPCKIEFTVWFKKKLFVAFPWVETSTGPGGFMICVFFNMTGTPEGSTESGFIEKPGIEPATPGLQGIALIHYTTGASLQSGFKWFCVANNLDGRAQHYGWPQHK